MVLRNDVGPAVVVVVGGAILLLSHVISPESAETFWMYVLLQGAGFALILTGTALGRPATDEKLPWLFILIGSATWLFCWSWFLQLGIFLPVPLAVWGGIATASFAAATVNSRREMQNWHATALSLAVGSAVAMVLLVRDWGLISDYAYAFFAAGAVVGGLVLLRVSSRASRTTSAQQS